MSEVLALRKANRATGKVFLVGAGPGDPELLTLKADRLLKSADVVVFDNLVGAAIVALIPARTRRIYAGKESGRHSMPQAEINRLLVNLASEGLQVVRLKGGDPFIFGRGGEEIEELVAAGISFEVVPGITAASGVAAYAGIPLTHREHAQTLIFTTGHLRDGSLDLDWGALARPRQTVVIYMGLAALPEICRCLVDHGLPPETPAAVVQQASTPLQREVMATLSTLEQAVATAGLQSPALIVIGGVVDLHSKMRWFAAAAAQPLATAIHH
ncbi:MAG: uroporphyrinogen-III C-methyltransferase [Bacteroidota bacterium]